MNKCDKVSGGILSDIPKSIFLINDHAKIQSFGKLHGCCTFEDYADAFMASVFKHFGHITTQVMPHVIAT